VTRGQLPQRAGSLGLTAVGLPPRYPQTTSHWSNNMQEIQFNSALSNNQCDACATSHCFSTTSVASTTYLYKKAQLSPTNPRAMLSNFTIHYPHDAILLYIARWMIVAKCVSLPPSDIVSKWLNISRKLFHCFIAPSF